MALNRLQFQIFKQLSGSHNLELEEYLLQFSRKYVQRLITTLDDLSENEADSWITKAYIESLG